jgi:hypothetical protein
MDDTFSIKLKLSYQRAHQLPLAKPECLTFTRRALFVRLPFCHAYVGELAGRGDQEHILVVYEKGVPAEPLGPTVLAFSCKWAPRVHLYWPVMPADNDADDD